MKTDIFHTRPFKHDLNQIHYNYTVEVTKRFKVLDLIECLKSYGQRFCWYIFRKGRIISFAIVYFLFWFVFVKWSFDLELIVQNINIYEKEKTRKKKTKNKTKKYINIYHIYKYTEKKDWLFISPSQRIMSILNTSHQEEKGFPGGSDSKEFSCNAGHPGLIPGSGRSPGEGNGYPLQYSCLENSMDRGTWQATYSPQGQKESGTTERLRWKINLISLWKLED